MDVKGKKHEQWQSSDHQSIYINNPELHSVLFVYHTTGTIQNLKRSKYKRSNLNCTGGSEK